MWNTRICSSRNYKGRWLRQSSRFLEHWSHLIHFVPFIFFQEKKTNQCHRLCGFPPFYAESNEELFDQIKKGKYDFPSPHWDQISDMAKDLIKRILIVDPTQRMDADAILAHPWVIGEKTPRKPLPHVTGKIREFNAKRKFKASLFLFSQALKHRPELTTKIEIGNGGYSGKED